MKHVSFVFLLYFMRSSNCEQITRKLFPIKYDLTITPYFENDSDSRFEGKLAFTFKPFRHHATSTLALHADGLDFQSFVLLEERDNSTNQLLANSEYDSDQQLVTFDTGYPLSVDSTFVLHINYTGRITDDGWGLYKGSYDHEGGRRNYVVTQLRPVFARRLLPCLDEPSYKARFVLRIWRLPNYTAISNTPCIDTSPMNLDSGRVLDTFAETPPMSTFLLALAVFDFSFITSPDKKFSSWAVPSKINLLEYSQKLVPALVKAMEDITGSKFSMAKMDQIALPQLNPVAMENWGMNTYREQLMFFQEGKYPPKARQDVPRFTGHEVAHYWLGNMVTLEWWDWLWLSEMYAMYYECYLTSQIEPSWRMADQIVVELSIPGLLEDSFNNSRPLTTHVSTNQEILAQFSGVIYTKGPALVRMINNFMTPSRAERAIRQLLREKKYGTVNPTELWKIYDVHADGLPTTMETIMSSWTEQAGYPVVSVSINHSDGTVNVQQERFLVEGTVNSSSLWWIPLTFTSGDKANFTHTHTRVWVTPEKPVTVIKLGQSINSWLLFNVQYVGFYRVNYNSENWDRLTTSLLMDPASIHDLNRAQLLDDSFSLARGGYLPYSVPLRLASYLKKEGCYFPWSAVVPSINFLLMRLNGHPAYDYFKDYVKELVSPIYDSVGFYLNLSDSQLLQLNRVQVVTLACSLGLPVCVLAAQNQENLTVQGKSSMVPPGLESVQLCTVLEAGVSIDDIFYHLSVWGPQDQIRAMPCVADKSVLIRYLTKSLQEDSAADWRLKLVAAVTRLSNIDSVFNLLLNEYQTLFSRFGAKNVTDYFSQVGNFLTTNAQLIEVKRLQTDVNNEEVVLALNNISARLLDRLEWIKIHVPVIESWLLAYNREKTQKDTTSLVKCL